jgi:RNA polymerase sigma-70 factor, ECF subfamily
VSALHFPYVRYADDVHGYVESIVRDRNEAEDITQDVFAKLITAIDRYEQREAPFATWILRVARDAALERLGSPSDVPVEKSA